MAKKSKFNLSNKFAGTCDLGELVPINCIEVLPGDIFNYESNVLIRMSPMLAPQLTKLNAYVAHYFVPNRLVWDDWEDFITGGESGNEAPTFPTINLGSVSKSSLADYFGIPKGVANTTVNALPFRGYAMIWNEYYRDLDIQATPLVIDTTSGADTTTSTSLSRVNWAKDHFTSAKPWEQRGTAVSLPLGTSAPLSSTTIESNSNTIKLSSTSLTNDNLQAQSSAVVRTTSNPSGTEDLHFGSETGVRIPATTVADLSTATAAEISDLREAFGLQRFMERQALTGGKYSEYLKQYGVRNLDGRLQKPEYLGGGKTPIQISEVLQTGVDSTDGGVGTLYGHGIGGLKSNRFTRFFEEHGYVISVFFIRPEAHYIDGLNRMWSKSVREDFYDRDLAGIGMQAVLNKEVYLGHSSPNDTHGFNWRYYDYMKRSNTIAGDFVDSTANHWHLARDFSSDTALNHSFVSCNPGKRVFADQTNDSVYLLASNNVKAIRPMVPTTEFTKLPY